MSGQDTALAALLDRAALHDLAMRYSRAIDRRDPELLGSVYHHDAHDEHGTFFDGPAAEFIANLEQMMAGYEVTQHTIGNASYRLDGDKAQGELYFTAYQRTIPPEPRHEIVQGRYLDHYERRNGEWRIADRRLVWDRFETRPVQEADSAVLTSLGEPGRGADDYSYRSLDLLGRGR